MPVTELVEEFYCERVWRRLVTGAIECGGCVCQYCEGQKVLEKRQRLKYEGGTVVYGGAPHPA